MADGDGGHNFRLLKENILSMSEAKLDWELAKKEWKLVGVHEADEPETCLCGHTPIIEICTLANTVNGNRAEVGNRCVKRFLGLRSDLIFAGIKRVRADITKALNEDATIYFHRQGALNAWEYQFQNSTMKKRVLSGKQLEKRIGINQKALNFMARRGL